MKKLPTINIKGSEYTLVKDRVLYFNETYPKGSIIAELVSDVESDVVVVKATITPDVEQPTRVFIDYSQSIKGDGFINKTAALENASTSAVGRALAMMGIGVIDSVASVDEVNKAQGSTGKRTATATEKQIEWMRNEASRASGTEHLEDIDKWIESVLTIKVEQVPSYKVKAAVDKIRENNETSKPKELPVINLTDEQADKALREMADGTLPY